MQDLRLILGVLALALALGAGAEHIVHGSDYPFVDFGKSLQWMENLPLARREAIMGRNPGRLFGTA